MISRIRLLGLLLLSMVGGACASAGTRRSVAQPCMGNDTIYVRADTSRGLQLPDNRSTPRLYFRRGGGATAFILIDTNGNVAVESVQTTGGFGAAEERQIQTAVGRWTFYAATLNGCAVRFRGVVTFSAALR